MTEQKDDLEDRTKDLTLLLAYLTSWEEKVLPDRGVRRAWKGYDFGVLNQLEAEGVFHQSKGAKSLYFTEEGERRAEKLLAEYGIAEDGKGTGVRLR